MSTYRGELDVRIEYSLLSEHPVLTMDVNYYLSTFLGGVLFLRIPATLYSS